MKIIVSCSLSILHSVLLLCVYMLSWWDQVASEPYIGVEEVDAVQALAAVNAAFDATQGRFTLAHRQREGGGGRHSHSTSATGSTYRPI